MPPHEPAPGLAGEGRLNQWLWLGPAVFATVLGLYFVSRYGRLWAENDSAAFAFFIRGLLRHGSLFRAGLSVYPNGYGYQSLSAFVVSIAGLSPAALQQLVYPLLAGLVALPAWAAYRELTGRGRGATLAVVLLFTQPEFLFVVLRSSHEKFTRSLMFLCLFLLVRSFRSRSRPGFFATLVALFYLAAFGIIACNNLMAHSFIFAIALAMLGGWLLGRLFPHLRPAGSRLYGRLSYVALTCLGLVWVSMFYLYPPSLHDLGALQSIADRTAALALDVQNQSTNAYAQVAQAWVGPYTYFLLTAANWVVLLSSLAIWLAQGWNWIIRRRSPGTGAEWLLWLLYAAFALQGALSVVVDASGALGVNMQQRVFPSFSMIAVAPVAWALARWRPGRFADPARLALGGVLGCLAVLSALKATDEPALSNWWMFYRPYELSTVEWADSHLEESNIWTDFTERLSMAFLIVDDRSVNDNHLTAYYPEPGTRDFVITAATRLRSSRTGEPLPVEFDSLVTFDDGGGQLYHLRPRTPFQR